jgi:hypothetical protein
VADVKQLMIDARVLKVLAVTHPELIQEVQTGITPVMHDLIMIRDIYSFVSLSRKPQSHYLDKLLFIAVILRLFNPDALIIDCKLKNGLRRSLAECLGDSGQNASYYIGQARAYMSIKSFKASVATIVDQYLHQEGKA